ncbi:type II toxin-antitoxin system HicB family antitoxin [Treponema phagedenis]|uniref:type II toxin-antitoxin system HicB family antitoxin n=1 Tax=Treponema phagedenis TaxID=162 RepID=UPI000467B677|nr:type II toxin-antitoxin system HicB family antitoxin [Treponema phagedenis]QEK00449.1 HicB family protein [Treponema phagedenis]QEK05459.1 HicB family protein [Treponema phagedenis]
MYIYPAIFYKEGSGYSVVFHDIELATCGDTLEEAIIMAEEALTGRVYLMLKDGHTLPLPSSIEKIKKPKAAELISLIKTDKKYLTQEKSVRKNLTLPAWLAEAAENANLNFSQELQNALKAKLGINI